MDIVFCVAGDAIMFGVFKYARTMAFFTRQSGMRSEQRKASDVMIKVHLFQPAFLAVALMTFFTLLAIVNIMLTVTVITFGADLVLEQIAGMTITTGNILVLAG